MRAAGKITGLMRDLSSGHYLLQLEVDARITKGFDDLKNDTVDISIVRHRDNRSKSQNALYWSYVTQLAGAVGCSNAYMHNELISRFGEPVTCEGKTAFVVLPDDPKVMESETLHLSPTSEIRRGRDGTLYRTYRLMRGSSDYNTQEMTRLIDGAQQTAREMEIHLEEKIYCN